MTTSDIYTEAERAQDALEAAMRPRRSTQRVDPVHTGDTIPTPIRVVPVGVGTPVTRTPVRAVRIEETSIRPTPLPHVGRETPRARVEPVAWDEEAEETPSIAPRESSAALPVAPSPSRSTQRGKRAVEEAPRGEKPKRKRRPAGQRRIIGTDRDRTILDRLVLVGLATVDIATLLLSDGHSTSNAVEKRLREMQAAGLTRRIQGVWACPTVWLPTKRGTGLSRFPEAPVRSSTDLPWNTAQHELRVAEVVGLLASGALQRALPAWVPADSAPMTGRLIASAQGKRGFAEISEFGSLSEILDHPECLAVRKTDHSRGGWTPKIPDLVLIRRGMRPLAIEVELSAKRASDYREIFADAYADSGMDVLYLTGTPGIADRVSAAARSAGLEVADPRHASATVDRTIVGVLPADLSWAHA